MSQSGAFVLDASEVVLDGQAVYRWSLISRPDGSSAQILESASPIAQLPVDAIGAYTVELLISVDGVVAAPLLATIANDGTASDATAPQPRVDVDFAAGVAAVGEPVRLSGGSSVSPAGLPLSFAWSLVAQPDGSAAILAAASGLNNEFIPDLEGEYVVQLTATSPDGSAKATTVTLTTGQSVVEAKAGPDRSVRVGETVFVDGFSSIGRASAELTQDWELIARPAGSAARILDGGELDRPQQGRFLITPDIPGTYVARLRIEDGSAEDVDFVVVTAGDEASINVAPIADAGPDRLGVAGSAIALTGIGSSDFDGDELSYRWSLVSSPEGSLAGLSAADGLQTELLSDLSGDYVVQLSVDDGTRVSQDTVVVSTQRVGPVAAAGADAVLPDNSIADVDGSRSRSASESALTYLWSVSGLGTPGAADAAEIANAGDPLARIDFNADPGAVSNPAGRFGEYDLVVFQNSVSNSQSRGRTFIGGNLEGSSSDYGNALNGVARGKVILTVGGNISGNPKNINNGGSVAVGGNIDARLNLNGGGQASGNQNVDISSVRRDLESFSALLRDMDDTGQIVIPSGQPGGVTLNAVPGPDGVAVFSLPDGNRLFGNDRVQSIDIRDNGAEAIVVNVGGGNININRANFVGNANNDAVRSKVLWNFHQASNIVLERHLSGSLLAPEAALRNQSPIYGAAVVDQLDHRAAIGFPGFDGNAAFVAAPEPIGTAVVQLRVNDGVANAFDTVLLTNANIAPVAEISVSAEAVSPGTPVTLDANASSDANGDGLIYRWSLLSRPEGSESAIVGSGPQIAITPDSRGAYAVQLIVSDGALFSEPRTIVFFGSNRAPAIVSEAIVQGVTNRPYSYQASAADPDGDILVWSLETAPDGMTIDRNTGLIGWIPGVVGTFDVRVAVEDPFNARDVQDFAIAVEQGGNLLPPVIAPIADVVLRPGETVSFTVEASDPDSDAISFQALPLPQGATFDTATGAFVFTAGSTLGVNTIEFFATDGVLTSSRSVNIEVVANLDTDPTRLSGRVLDAADFANGIETPIQGASVDLGGIVVLSGADGRFVFADLSRTGANALNVTAAGVTAPDGSPYGSASGRVFVFENGTNILQAPILLARLGDEPVQLSDVQDTLPPQLRSCRIQRLDALAGGNVPLSDVPLRAFDPLVPGTRAVVWARDAGNTTYRIVGEGTIAGNGLTLENATGSAAAGANLVVTALPLSVQDNDIQPRSRQLPTLLGEGNLQTAFTLPSYQSLGSNRAPSFIYNSIAADPRPIITANVELPADTTLTDNIQVEVFVNGQRMPGVGIIDIGRAAVDGTALPEQGTTVTTAISVAFNGAAIPTGVHPYELFVFAGHECAAAGARATGDVFINNRSQSPYGAGWKPSEIQTLIQLPDGSVAIEEPDGTISLYDGGGEIAAPIEEEFEAGLGGWSINADGQDLSFQPTGGNPDGHITARDAPTGDIWFFIAPDGVVENLRGFLDGQLTFDIRQDSSTSQFDSIDIVIFGEGENGETLIAGFDFPNNPLTIFTTFTSRLDGEGWLLLEPATAGSTSNFNVIGDIRRDQFIRVLQSATRFQIRGEFRVGADRAFLDNVRFFGRDAIGEILAFETPNGNFDVLVQNTDGTFARRYKNGSVVTFNTEGLQTSLTDANGNTSSYEYDADGRVTSITDPVGLVTAYEYNPDGRLASVTTPDNRTSLFLYDPFGNLLSAEFPNISFPQSVARPDGTIATLSPGAGASVPYVRQSFTVGSTSITWGYDENGRIVSQVDEREQTSTFEYGAGGRIEAATLPDLGRVQVNVARTVGLAEFGIDLSAPVSGAFVEPDQRVTRIVDARGFPTEQEVNDFGAVIRKQDQIGRETFFERNEDNLVTRVDAPSSVTPSGRLISAFSYDEQGNMLTRRDAVGTPSERAMSYEFEPEFSQVTRMTDFSGFVYSYDYDERSNRIRRVNPDNTEMLYTYDERGLMLTYTDERGNVMSYEYNALGLYTQMTDPRGIDTTRTLDASGNPSVMVYANGTNVAQVVVNFFDDENRPIATINGENERFQRTYDRNGNPRTYLDDTGVGGDNLYDDKSRLIVRRDPASGDTAYTYDVNDNITRMVESDGETTSYAYDPANRMTDSVDGIGDTRRYVYDSRDNIIAITDARGNTTTYAYDELDRVIARTNQVGNTWRFEYDPRDLRTATIKPDGTRIEFAYDNRRRLVSYGAAGEPESLRTFAYDEENLLIGAQAAAGTANQITHSFAYDERDQLSRAALSAGPLGNAFSFSYEYDPLERRSTMRDSAGAVTSYSYDDANRLTGMVLPSGLAAAFEYDDASRRVNVAMPNGMNARMVFSTPSGNGETTGLLARIAHGLNDLGNPGSPLNARLGTFDYGYDSKANIIAIAENGSIDRARVYTLDPIERLVGVSDRLGAAVESYTLDNEGNRLTSHLASFHVTDPANRVSEDANFEFDYDVNGNLIRKTEKATGVTYRYSYSVYDELIEVARSASPAAGAAIEFRLAYVFDALGRRHTERKFDGTGALTRGANFRYDGDHLAHEELVGPSGAVESVRWYTHSDYTDELISLTLPAGDAGTLSPTSTVAGPGGPSNADFYAHVDHQGSLRAFTDSNIDVVNDYTYDSYGRIDTEIEGVEQRFRYTGRFYDKDTELYHYRARAYDPETGRFLQEDPIWFAAGDLNVHRYVWNNPVNWTDPSGLSAVEYGGTAGSSGARAGGLAGLGFSLRNAFTAIAAALAVTPALNTPAGEDPSANNSPNTGGDDGVGNGNSPSKSKPNNANNPAASTPAPASPEPDGEEPEEKPNPKSVKQFGHTFIRHGAGARNTRNLQGRAASTGTPQGQFLNNQRAADFLSRFKGLSEPTTVSAPRGLGQVINPNGSISPATKIKVIPNSNGGIRSAFPIK